MHKTSQMVCLIALLVLMATSCMARSMEIQAVHGNEVDHLNENDQNSTGTIDHHHHGYHCAPGCDRGRPRPDPCNAFRHFSFDDLDRCAAVCPNVCNVRLGCNYYNCDGRGPFSGAPFACLCDRR